MSTPKSAPVIAISRLRKGSTSSARGAASFFASGHADRCGASGLRLARVDSAFFVADVVAAISRASAKLSIIARLNRLVRAAIAGIREDAWTPSDYPNAIWDDQADGWISDAEASETAFTFRGGPAVTARLIVRRVKLIHPAGKAQPSLGEGRRHHAVFSTTLTMLQAENCRRVHVMVKPVMPDLKAGPLDDLHSESSLPTRPGRSAQ